MKLIVGLGNYGAEYARTRHNIGFMAVEKLAEQLGISFAKEKFHARLAEARINGQKVLLMQPLTYMNKSGLAVTEVKNFFHLDLTDILIIYDDMDMPCGRMKVKKKGSGGGHRGMGDIITCLGSEEISRIKVGIDHPLYGTVVDYVLKPFSGEEWQHINPALEQAAAAALYWVNNGIQETMNVYNGYGKEGAQKPKPQREAAKAAKKTARLAAALSDEGETAVSENFSEQTEKEQTEKNQKFLRMLREFLHSDR